MKRPYFRDVNNKATPIISEFGGVMMNTDPISIGEKFAARMKNISAVSYPLLKQREKRKLFGETDGEIQFISVMEGKYITIVEKSGSVCKWKYYSGGWKEICVVRESPSGKYDMLYFMNRTILVTGNLRTVSGVAKTDSYEAWFEGGVLKTASKQKLPQGDMIETINNRLAVAYSENDKIYLGGIMDQDVWFDIDDGLEQNVITQNGETGQGLRTYGGHLAYFKPHSFGEIYGNTPDSYSMIMVSEGIGCVAGGTICDCGNLLWLSGSGVCAYGGGALPKVISEPIDSYIKNIDYDRVHEAAAGCDAQRYIICLPQKDGGHINCVYNFVTGIWVVEDDTHFTGFALWGDRLYAAATGGRIYRLWDEEDEDNGEVISWEYASRVFKIDPTKKLSLRRLHIICDLEGSITVTIVGDNGETLESKSEVLAEEGTCRKIIYVNLHPSVFSGRDTFQVLMSGEGKATVHSVGASIRVRSTSY